MHVNIQPLDRTIGILHF